MNSFELLESQWGDYLYNNGDINSIDHLSFLSRLYAIAHDFACEIPSERFYVQNEAGFQRLRILEILDNCGTQYQVNFHVFSKSQTHIHSHGYDAHSFVLEGELHYQNFIPQSIGGDKALILREKFKQLELLWGDDYEKNVKIVIQDFKKNIFGSEEGFSYTSEIFSAFIGGGDDDEFGKITQPSDIQFLVKDIYDIFYQLLEAGGAVVNRGGEYSIGRKQAHSVRVDNFATTLFITKKNQNSGVGGEYLKFPHHTGENQHNSLKPTHESVKQQILHHLRK